VAWKWKLRVGVSGDLRQSAPVMDEAYLTSAKLSGSSHSSAPPKRPTFLYLLPGMVYVSRAASNARYRSWGF
jgi:hypothetical protein